MKVEGVKCVCTAGVGTSTGQALIPQLWDRVGGPHALSPPPPP